MTENLGNSLDLVSVTDEKFRTSTLLLVLNVPVVPEKNAAYTLAQSLLCASCRKYPNITAMSKKLDDMYGAVLNSSVSTRGSVMQCAFSGVTIADRYALEGEPLLEELCTLLLDCLFDPNVKGEAFDEGEFAIQKQELLDAIDAEINNKRSYARSRAREKAFEGEPDAYPVYGKREDVEPLTPQSVYQAYKELLRRSAVRIYYAGPVPAPELAGRFADAFAKLERTPEPLQFYAPSTLRETPVRVTEPMEVVQSKLVMVLKHGKLPRETVQLFSAVFGATPFSMLFMNVREKLSLCYYCVSRPMLGKDALFIESGVELDNAERAHDAILEQLDTLRRGDFSEELLENAKHSIVGALRGIGDSPMSCLADANDRYAEQDAADIEERIARYEALTKQDIMEAAASMQEDTVYLMQQGGAV